jgi:hypothetical protein
MAARPSVFAIQTYFLIVRPAFAKENSNPKQTLVGPQDSECRSIHRSWRIALDG